MKVVVRIACFILLVFSASCKWSKYIAKSPSNGKYYLYDNEIKVTGGEFTRTQRKDLQNRLYGQLDDSSRIRTKTKFIFLKYLRNPIAYDTAYSGISARSMRGSMYHIGYYQSQVSYTMDTCKKGGLFISRSKKGKRIKVLYTVNAGKPTLVDTVSYNLRKNDLQQLALQYRTGSYLVKNEPVTKVSVISEINRLVDTFRNNGYYKFTAAEVKVRGDTTIAALTTVTDDPFEQLRLLAEAEANKDSPKIRLSVVLNPPNDSTRLNQYRIHKIYILPDYRQGDSLFDTTGITQRITSNFILRYHNLSFRTRLFSRNIIMRPGQLFRQNDYYQSLNNLSRAGVWQSVNIQTIEVADSTGLVNLVIELIPFKKFGFEAALELSYSASSNSSNVLAGNLFGLSGNLSLLNRNLAREAIRMTHNIRAGVELNNNNRGAKTKLINSNEIGYSNTTSFPRMVFPGIPNWISSGFSVKKQAKNINRRERTKGESFINLGISFNNRLNLFNLQSVNGSFGWTSSTKKGLKWTFTPLNFGFSYLFNQSDSFKNILKENPFLQYSYNTAFVIGIGAGISKSKSLPHPNSLSRELNWRINVEESGLTWGQLPLLKNYKRRYVKGDFEAKYNVNYGKSLWAFRGFLGIGSPLLGSDSNRTLPFFKQYYGGGSNSMRAWPVRGIGPGGRPLIPYSSNKTIFNDRTGDMQLEFNVEYRYDIARIIPNTLTLRGALFADIGNIWNIKNTKTDGTVDSSQFKNLGSQLGVAAGTGLRLDFNYFVLRLDFGFRFKRPELFYSDNGWKAPPIGFDDFLKKIFTRGKNDEYRKWRYENFNFTIGIGYWF
jgi:hypothetical protein